MNTKIQFFCTHLSQGEFTKIIFETILSDQSIESTSDAENWVDDNVSTHYDEFLLDVVLDWGVISFKETKTKPKETEIIKTVRGRLFFEDELDYFYYRIGKAKEETRQIKKETRKIKKETKEITEKIKAGRKEYPSVWIDLSGVIYEVGFANHNEFADDWFEQNEPEEFERIHTEYTGKYAYEHLQDKGWIRILGWNDPPNFVIPTRITPKQRTSLRDYCLNNEVPYAAFPEILKS